MSSNSAVLSHSSEPLSQRDEDLSAALGSAAAIKADRRALRSSLLGAPLGPKGVGSLSKAKGAPDPTTAEARAAAAAVLRLFPAQKENELTPSRLVLQGLAFARNFSPLRAN